MKTPREVLFEKHRLVEPKLERMWARIAARPVVAPYQLIAALWRELVWPCRRIWVGLACAWALIVALNLASSEPASPAASKAEPRSRDEMQALIEQRRLLAQLIESASAPSDEHESKPPGPRSERALKTLAA
jgi:hypothetical protein